MPTSQTFTAIHDPQAFDLGDNHGPTLPQDDITTVTNEGPGFLHVTPWKSGYNFGFGPFAAWARVAPGDSVAFYGMGATGGRLAVMASADPPAIASCTFTVVRSVREVAA